MPDETSLSARVERARRRPPLAQASAAQWRELTELLEDCRRLEDLPGKWQAAILSAETPRPPGEHTAHACAGDHR